LNVTILGASGFIGRHLFSHFSKIQGINLKGIYFSSDANYLKNDSRYFKADLRNLNDVREVIKNTEVIIQAAASTTGINDAVNNPSIHVTDNAIMNSLILREAASKGVSKFIFLSCTVMYQKEKTPFQMDPVCETDDHLSDEIYPTYHGAGWTKVYIEKMCKFYSLNSAMTTHCIRHSNIYGPGDKFDPLRSHVIGATIRKIHESDFNPIKVWGDGSEFRDYIYISDLINAIEQLVNLKIQEKFNIWNVGSGIGIKISDLVKIIRRLADKEKRQIVFDANKPTAKTGVILNSDKLFRACGWKPQVSLEAGLEKTIDWYKRNILTNQFY
jgi:nucleoside-diphosphate-sugar epimerase